MSLIVRLIAKDVNMDIGKIETELKPPFNDLFGFESWRRAVWGHEAIKAIGCDMLYSLSGGDVFAFDEEIERLKIELNRIIEHLVIVCDTIGLEQESLAFRVRNALECIEVAERHRDRVGVYIG